WPPMLLAAARFTFVVIPAIVFVRFPRGSFGRILLIGVFMTAGQFALLYTAMSLGLPAGLASIVIQIQAAFTVIVAALALRRVPRPRRLVLPPRQLRSYPAHRGVHARRTVRAALHSHVPRAAGRAGLDRHPDPGCLHRHRRRPRPPRGSAPPAGAGHRR